MNVCSAGEFCCGPCPVTAIKEGNLGVKYDAPFVFAEVNADIIYWMVQRDGQRKKVTDVCRDCLSHFLQLKSSGDSDDCHYCYRSERTRGVWGGTSAPKVFTATTEKMSLYTTNILKVSWKVTQRSRQNRVSGCRNAQLPY